MFRPKEPTELKYCHKSTELNSENEYFNVFKFLALSKSASTWIYSSTLLLVRVGVCLCYTERLIQPMQTCFADRPQIIHRFNCDWLKSEVVHKREKCEKA